MKNAIVIASNNAGKIAEFYNIIGQDYNLVSMSQVGFDKDIPEPFDTFFENALTKAKTVYDSVGMPCIADDSGICIKYLNDAPGVKSARFSGGNDSDNVDKILTLMQGVCDRRAKFVSCIVLYFDKDKYVTASGEVHGDILQQRDGTNGFGYDPIFFSDELKMSLGQASMQQKNTISHRAKALRDVVQKYKSI